MKFATNIDLMLNELQNAKLQPLATAPSSPVAGQIYFNTTAKKPYIFSGTAWIDMGFTYTHPSTHPASIITQDTNNRFVTDAEKALWNSAEANAKDYANTLINNLVNGAGSALDTLKELADALGNDPNFATTITNLIATKTGKYAQNIGNGSATSFVVTHGLNSRDVQVSIYENASPYNQVFADVQMTSTSVVTVLFATAPTSNQYRVVVQG